jgi:hypothetical protein
MVLRNGVVILTTYYYLSEDSTLTSHHPKIQQWIYNLIIYFYEYLVQISAA